jgi:hypothetical protein
LNGTPCALEPVEVGDALLAEDADLRLVGLGPARGHEEREHLLGGVLDAAGLLHRRPAAHVDEAAGHRGGAAPAAGALEHEHPGARLGRLDRRARAGAAEADDHDVGLRVPRRDLVRVADGRRLDSPAAHVTVLPEARWRS